MSLAFSPAAALPGLRPAALSPAATALNRRRPRAPVAQAGRPPKHAARQASATILKTLGLAAAGLVLSGAASDALPASIGRVFGAGAAQASALVAEPFRLNRATAPDDAAAQAHGSLQAHWDLHSTACDTETFVVFENDSSHVVDLWWIDYVGTEVFYASINPGMTFLQQSFASHPWVVRDHVSQNSVLVLVATPQPLMAVVHNV